MCIEALISVFSFICLQLAKYKIATSKLTPTKKNLITKLKRKKLSDNYKNPKFLKKNLHNLQTQESPSHFFVFRLNSGRDLESLISGDNVDHKRHPLYSIFSCPYVVILLLAVANDFHFLSCADYFSQEKRLPERLLAINKESLDSLMKITDLKVLLRYVALLCTPPSDFSCSAS